MQTVLNKEVATSSLSCSSVRFLRKPPNWPQTGAPFQAELSLKEKAIMMGKQGSGSGVSEFVCSRVRECQMTHFVTLPEGKGLYVNVQSCKKDFGCTGVHAWKRFHRVCFHSV
eukprot:1158849-Pelagomonas_calceolata.AAC.4